jgi:hypothetical protein
MRALLLSLFHDVPAGEQQPLDAGLGLPDALAGLADLGEGVAQGLVLLAALFGVGGGARREAIHG